MKDIEVECPYCHSEDTCITQDIRVPISLSADEDGKVHRSVIAPINELLDAALPNFSETYDFSGVCFHCGKSFDVVVDDDGFPKAEPLTFSVPLVDRKHIALNKEVLERRIDKLVEPWKFLWDKEERKSS